MYMCEFVYSTTQTRPKRREQKGNEGQTYKKTEEMNAYMYIYIYIYI
jgi:hypothetical protein